MDDGRAPASLREQLERERDCCLGLARLIEVERSAVAQRDLPRLLDAVKEREVLQARWQRIAASRASLRGAAGKAAGASTNASPDESLASLVAEVRAAAEALTRAQRTNAAIVRGALEQVSGLLATVRRAQPGSRYDDRAALNAPLPHAAGAGWSA